MIHLCTLTLTHKINARSFFQGGCRDGEESAELGLKGKCDAGGGR